MELKPKILIVEDNKYNHRLYRDAFERNGFEVILRENADGFFANDVSEIAPDIISMDLMMGKDGAPTERDGFEAIKNLRGDLRTHKIPIIVLTSFFEENKVRKAKELGVVDFISTPGQTMDKIPKYFLRYLKNPKRYIPSHSFFRKDTK